MRYSDGGGLTAEGRSRREMVRRQAAGLFEQGVDPVQVAGLLRVTTKSAYLLHRNGFTPQVPAHRAIERDEAAIAERRAVTWAKARG